MAIFVPPAHAQTVGGPEVAIGYSILRDVTSADSASDPYHGWLVSGAYPLAWARVSLTGEAGTNSRTNVVDEVQRVSAFLGGARITVARASRIAAFVQFLAGVERFSEPGFTESGRAVQPGAGVDVAVWSGIAARVQGDVRFANQGGANYREWRLAVAARFVLGR
jgi:hypothetical protein